MNNKVLHIIVIIILVTTITSITLFVVTAIGVSLVFLLRAMALCIASIVPCVSSNFQKYTSSTRYYFDGKVISRHV